MRKEKEDGATGTLTPENIAERRKRMRMAATTAAEDGGEWLWKEEGRRKKCDAFCKIPFLSLNSKEKRERRRRERQKARRESVPIDLQKLEG